jgi:hypothetical protein
MSDVFCFFVCMIFSMQRNALLALGLGAANVLKEEAYSYAGKRARSAVADGIDAAAGYATSRRPTRRGTGRSFARYALGKRRRTTRRPSGRRRSRYRPKRMRRRTRKRAGRSIYNRRSKRMRPFNRGALSLQSKLMNGVSLPYQTAVSLYFRGTSAVLFNNVPTSNASRTFCLNSIMYASRSTIPIFNYSGWRYLDMWKMLYRKYCIIGSRITATIHRSNSTNSAMSGLNYTGEYPGYWYVRCFYYRDFDTTQAVGHPITPLTPQSEALWENRRDFIADPTVTFVQETRPRTNKVGYLGGPTTTTSSNPLLPSLNTYVEMEYNTKTIRLSANFSLRKHFATNNPLRDMPFLLWNDDFLNSSQAFYVQFGFIAFDAAGTVSAHTPFDRQPQRNLTIDIRTKAVLREPLIGPDGPESSSSAKRDFTEEELEQDSLLFRSITPHQKIPDHPTTEWDSEASQQGSEEEAASDWEE